MDENQKISDVDTPLEVDDDFAANLENLDADEVDDEIEEEQNPDSDEYRDNAEWNIGDVKQPEEHQLDPELWENEETNNEQETAKDPECDCFYFSAIFFSNFSRTKCN